MRLAVGSRVDQGRVIRVVGSGTENIEIDLTGLEVGDSLHISAVTLPEGTTAAITDRDFTIATIAAPSAQLEEDEEKEEELEGEGEIEGEGVVEGEAASEETKEE